MGRKKMIVEPVKEIFVGWQKQSDGSYHLHTIYPQAVHVLAGKGCEFHYDKKLGCMKAVAKAVPRDFSSPYGRVTFYEEYEENDPVHRGTRKAMEKDWDRLRRLEAERNKLMDRLADIKKEEQFIKRTMFDRLQKSGLQTKRGRWHHRMMWVRQGWRILCKIDFGQPSLEDSVDAVKALMKKFPKFKKDLNGCIKLDSVCIEPALFDKKFKKVMASLSKTEREQVYMDYAVSSEELEKILPRMPYRATADLLIPNMRSPVDTETGELIYTMHPQTYEVKNPDCNECGGDYKTGTNECQDCGLVYDDEESGSKIGTKARRHQKPNRKFTPDDSGWTGEESKRKRPKSGQSRY